MKTFVLTLRHLHMKQYLGMLPRHPLVLKFNLVRKKIIHSQV